MCLQEAVNIWYGHLWSPQLGDKWSYMVGCAESWMDRRQLCRKWPFCLGGHIKPGYALTSKQASNLLSSVTTCVVSLDQQVNLSQSFLRLCLCPLWTHQWILGNILSPLNRRWQSEVGSVENSQGPGAHDAWVGQGGWVCPTWRKSWGDFIDVCSYLLGGLREDGTRLFSWATAGRQ